MTKDSNKEREKDQLVSVTIGNKTGGSKRGVEEMNRCSNLCSTTFYCSHSSYSYREIKMDNPTGAAAAHRSARQPR